MLQTAAQRGVRVNVIVHEQVGQNSSCMYFRELASRIWAPKNTDIITSQHPLIRSNICRISILISQYSATRTSHLARLTGHRMRSYAWSMAEPPLLGDSTCASDVGIPTSTPFPMSIPLTRIPSSQDRTTKTPESSIHKTVHAGSKTPSIGTRLLVWDGPMLPCVCMVKLSMIYGATLWRGGTSFMV